MNAIIEPRNARRIIDMRRSGASLAAGVAVSYIGRTSLMAPHVYCDSGRRYDWEFLRGVQTYLVCRPGIDCGNAIRGLYKVANTVHTGYPILIDVDREIMAYIVDGFKLWQVSRDSQQWKTVFPIRLLDRLDRVA